MDDNDPSSEEEKMQKNQIYDLRTRLTGVDQQKEYDAIAQFLKKNYAIAGDADVLRHVLNWFYNHVVTEKHKP